MWIIFLFDRFNGFQIILPAVRLSLIITFWCRPEKYGYIINTIFKCPAYCIYVLFKSFLSRHRLGLFSVISLSNCIHIALKSLECVNTLFVKFITHRGVLEKKRYHDDHVFISYQQCLTELPENKLYLDVKCHWDNIWPIFLNYYFWQTS